MATRSKIGKPAFATPSTADRQVQQVINNIRERFQFLEAETTALRAFIEANTSAAQLLQLRLQISALTTQVSQLTAGGGDPVVNAVIQALLAEPNGVVVLKDGTLITRSVVAGANVTVTNGTGFAGNITIASTGGGGGGSDVAFWLATEDLVDLLTEDNQNLAVQFRVDTSQSLLLEDGADELADQTDDPIFTE